MANPFSLGSPVQGQDFVGRRREMRYLREAVQKGSSAALSAEPRMGKTSLLLQAQRRDLYEGGIPNLEFVYLDAQTLSGWDAPRFWEAALQPFKEHPGVKAAYRSASLEKFDSFPLERFFVQLGEAGLRLVLLLDEFDQVLDEPGLHTAGFYGNLRNLASLHASFSLILAVRQPVEELNRRTQQYSRLSSPYFNTSHAISLGAFSDKEIAELLAKASGVFNGDDRRYLARISGGHPYFLQAAAYYLWEAYAEKQKDPNQRRKWAGKQAFAQAVPALQESWHAWKPEQQMAFSLAALDEIPLLLPERTFDVNRLLRDFPLFAQEQRLLEQRGFLKADKKLAGGYAPQAEMMTWFLVEELTSLLRPSKPDVKTWLKSQQWDGLLKEGEKESIQKVLLAFKPLLQEGVSAFIQATVQKLFAA